MSWGAAFVAAGRHQNSKIQTVTDAERLMRALDSIQCGCTIAEQDKGHKSGCWMPGLVAARAAFVPGDLSPWIDVKDPKEPAPPNVTLIVACADWPHSTELGKPVPVKMGYLSAEGRWTVWGASWTPTHYKIAPRGRGRHAASCTDAVSMSRQRKSVVVGRSAADARKAGPRRPRKKRVGGVEGSEVEAPLGSGVADAAARLDLIYDLKTRRPACALLQAVFGCGASSRALRCFDSETWLTAPTPTMRKVSGTLDEWRQLALLAPRRAPRRLARVSTAQDREGQS